MVCMDIGRSKQGEGGGGTDAWRVFVRKKSMLKPEASTKPDISSGLDPFIPSLGTPKRSTHMHTLKDTP